MAKFTFKTIKPTGKYRSFGNDYYEIKLLRKNCGGIYGEEPYKIRLMVKKEVTKENPCPFKWITLKAEFKSISEAKDFLIRNTNKIIEKFELHFLES